MTEQAIKEQLMINKMVTEKACKSKESAIQFLKDAGIYQRLKIKASTKKYTVKHN